VKKGKWLCVAIIAFLFATVSAQTAKPGIPDPEEAKEHFKNHNYVMALPIYQALVKKEAKDLTYNYRLGICFLMTNGHKKEAIPYLETATKNPGCELDGWMYLGQAYHHALRFDDAIKAFETYKLKADKDGKINAEHSIEQCKNAKILVSKPVDVSFVGLGKEVNSEFPDYYPFVTSDESMLVFTSRRKGNVGAASVEMDGYYSSDIYMSKSLNGVFPKAKSASSAINGNYDEICTGLSADGKWMTVYIDNIASYGDVYLSSYKNSFAKAEKMHENINGGFETAASLSPDGNVVYFSSKRSDGMGGIDIYMCRKLPANFGWGLPINISAINTQYDEEFPFIAPDGKTLYFSSQGFNSMGGFDLFYSVLNEEDGTWSAPRNVGYPVNSVGDDMTISFTENNRVAYISSDREGGLGDLDIWRIVFNEVQATSFTMVTGKIRFADTTTTVEGMDLTIMVTDKITNEDYGSYKPHPKNGRFVLALPPGKYLISLDAPGYKPVLETLNVFDIGPQGEMSKDIMLLKQ
jgi:tetratricopeptide (TPR) repeat protein